MIKITAKNAAAILLFGFFAIFVLRLTKNKYHMKDLKMYINGQFVESKSGKWIDVLNPSTEEVISRQPAATIEEADELGKTLMKVVYDMQ